MNTAKSIAALMLVIASSSALAEGGSDRLHGKMIRKRPPNSPCVSQAGTH
ncbi:co-regulatory protein PtrA N-terminal domain-containing protein [Pseudomonas asiatica]